MRCGGDLRAAMGDSTLRLMGWNTNSLSKKHSTHVQFINKLKNANKNYFILCDKRLDSNSKKEFKKLWGEQIYFNSYNSSEGDWLYCLRILSLQRILKLRILSRAIILNLLLLSRQREFK